MSSEHLASAQTELKGDLGASWNILDGASANYTDLGIARRFGGAAAAYSLRDIGAVNKPVARIRREPHDTTDAINDEQKFSANQVDSGSLEDWVNGKQETTLPADVSTAAAAYSLRKVKASYANDVVRIRRSSDNIEVDVAFDSDDKVSSSSLITNVAEEGGESGQTTATTVGEFLTEDVNVETSDFSSGVDGYSQSSHGEVTRVASFGGENDVIKYNQGGGSTPGGRNSIRNTGVSIYNNNSYTITFKYYAPSAYNNYYLNIGYSFGNYTSPSNYVQITNTGSWQTATLTMSAGFTYSSNVLHLRVSASNTGTESLYGATGTETIYYKDIVVTATNSGACVHTWYDQAKDLTQVSTYYNTPIASSNFPVSNATEQYGTYLGRDNVVKITTTAGTGQRYHQKDFGIGAGESVRFTAEIYIPSSNTNLNSFALATKFDVNGFDRKQGIITPTQDEWVNIDFNYVQTDDTTQRVIFWNNASSSPTASNSSDGDVIYFRNMVVTKVAKAQVNAVQDTADSQPKIAEDGALLDGIKFDADANGQNPQFLQVYTRLGVTTDHMVSVVFNGYQTDSQKFGSFLNTRNSNTGFQYGIAATDKVQAFYYAGSGNNANSSATNVIPNNNAKRLATFDKDGDTLTGFGNSATNGLSISNPVNTPTTTVTNIGVGGNVGDADDLGLRANINELLVYESDQASNRFLIESNINNHYKLYNDEYEWDDATNTEWQNSVQDGTTTFTANGKDGFTITADGDNICNFKYKFKSPSTASNNYYKVSFFVDDPNGLFEDAQLRSTATGSGATAQTITNGFNSLSLRTGSNFNFMTINLDGNGSSKTATLSNFKISRIARDGFVETWYDQSDNSNDATQPVADQQPKIVDNGGIVKNVKGFPSLKFESANLTELDIGLLITNLNSVSAYVVTQKDSGDTNRVAGFTQGVSSDNSRFYFPFYTSGTTPNLGYNDDADKISFGTTLTRTCNLYSAFSGDTNIEAFKNGSSVGTTALVDQAVTATDSKIGQLSNGFRFDGVISEIFLTTQKLQSDAATINTEVQSYYNL